MSDTFDNLVDRAATEFRRFCIEEPRYRVAWLIGDVRSGKSTLAQRIAEQENWKYINYTLEPGYFEQLADIIQRYQPDAFLTEIRQWCDQCSSSLLLLDEIDSLLATWSLDQRRAWASAASRLREMKCGLVLVTSCLDEHILQRYASNPSRPHIYVLPGGL